MRKPKLYCVVRYERGNGKGRGYVARFFRSSDEVCVGAAVWNRKARRFDDVRSSKGITLLPSDVQGFTTMVPDSIRCDGVPWYSNKDPYAE